MTTKLYNCIYKENKELKNIIKSKDEEIEDLKAKIQFNNINEIIIETSNSYILNINEHINNLEQLIKSKDEEIKYLNETINIENKKLKNKIMEIYNKEIEINNKNKKIIELQLNIFNKDKEIEKNKEDLNSKDKKIKDINDYIIILWNTINLKDKEIAKLKPIQDDETTSLLCSICLDNIHENDDNELKIETRCNHNFHKNCLDKWDKNTCPNCRSFL
jgi:chromosome segregation ATPase